MGQKIMCILEAKTSMEKGIPKPMLGNEKNSGKVSFFRM
jgi:hypothetical protein